jgi:hypothetical protein
MSCCARSVLLKCLDGMGSHAATLRHHAQREMRRTTARQPWSMPALGSAWQASLQTPRGHGDAAIAAERLVTAAFGEECGCTGTACGAGAAVVRWCTEEAGEG